MVKRPNLLGEVVEEEEKKVRKKRSKVKKDKTGHKTRDISEGAIIYVPRDDNMIPSGVPTLVATEQMNDIEYLLRAHLKSGVPILIRGPKGIAKTQKVAEFCETHKIPLIQLDCSEQTKRYDLIGRFIPADETVVFQIGDLARVIEIANTSGKAVICLEELNALTPNMQKVLNQLLDWRRHVYIPEVGKTYTINEGVELAIVATCNPSSYGGTFELNEDLLSRFTVYDIGYPNKDDEIGILTTLFKDLDDDVKEWIPRIVELAKETRRGVNDNQLSYALSTRDVVYLLENFIAYKEIFEKEGVDDPEEEAMELMKKGFLSKYESVERDTLEVRWKSNLGTSL